MRKGKLEILSLKRLRQLALATAAGLLVNGCTWDSVEPDTCFESDVLPVLVTYCTTSGCHNSVDRTEGYDFSNYDGIMQAVRPNRAADSDLYEAMTEQGDDHMPPAGSPQPSADQVEAIRAWIKAGAENSVNCRVSTCDTSAVVSYSATLRPILQGNCLGCHSGGGASGGLDFTDFATFQQASLNGRVQGAMLGSAGYAAMPPAGNPLPACNVDQIDKWVAAGAPNN
jgi:hypothetical protein